MSRAAGETEGLEAIDSMGELPVRMIRSAQEIFLPYFCLMATAGGAPCRG